MTRKWLAIVVVYGALLLLYAVVIAVSDESARTKLIEGALFVGTPGIVFALGVVPLWRATQSRLAFLTAGTVSAVAAFLLAVVTWGYALPLSAGLLAVAIADVDRALVLSGLAANRRFVAFGIVLVVGGFLLGLALPLAALAAVVGIVIVAWRLIRGRAILRS